MKNFIFVCDPDSIAILWIRDSLFRCSPPGEKMQGQAFEGIHSAEKSFLSLSLICNSTFCQDMKVSVFRKAYFNAAHRLFRLEWDGRKNLEVFGKCSHPNYHGHNYELVVKITGGVNPETGYVMDLGKLDALVQEHV